MFYRQHRCLTQTLAEGWRLPHCEIFAFSPLFFVLFCLEKSWECLDWNPQVSLQVISSQRSRSSGCLPCKPFIPQCTLLYQTHPSQTLISSRSTTAIIIQSLYIEYDTHSSFINKISSCGQSKDEAICRKRLQWYVPKDMTREEMCLYSRITDFWRLWSVRLLRTHHPMQPLVLWPEVCIQGLVTRSICGHFLPLLP